MADDLRGNSLRISNGSDKNEPTRAHYREQRFDEYPLVFDQLDAIWKQLAFDQTAGQTLHRDTNDMLNNLIRIKKRYPKTE